mgnify:CR=1 FL=1
MNRPAVQQDFSRNRIYQYEFTETRLWQRSRHLMSWVYIILQQINADADKILKDHIFHTALELPSVVAESYSKSLPPDIIRKLHQARHDTFRLENLFYLSYDLQLIGKEELEGLLAKTEEIKELINARTRQFKKK